MSTRGCEQKASPKVSAVFSFTAALSGQQQAKALGKFAFSFKTSEFMLTQILLCHPSFTGAGSDSTGITFTFQRLTAPTMGAQQVPVCRQRAHGSAEELKPGPCPRSCTVHPWKSPSLSQKSRSSLKYANKVFSLQL